MDALFRSRMHNDAMQNRARSNILYYT